MKKASLNEKFGIIHEQWRPKVVALPRGVEHRTMADHEAEVLVFEPAQTRNTGNVLDHKFTAPNGVVI